MAVVYKTTLVPTKLELLTAWLPTRPWYRGRAGGPNLTRVGGFRLDDPDGAVGIEFMLVADGEAVYHVPMTYRGEPLAGAEAGLIGTSEHGVLGRRWIYDAPYDPVFVEQLGALVSGAAQPQAQSDSDTPDASVSVRPVSDGPVGVAAARPVDGDDATDVTAGRHVLTVHRWLVPGESAGSASVSVPWSAADGAAVRGVVITGRPR